MGMPELPGRMRGSDITFAESRSPPTLVCRVRFLGSSNGFAFDPSAEDVQMSLLD